MHAYMYATSIDAHARTSSWIEGIYDTYTFSFIKMQTDISHVIHAQLWLTGCFATCQVFYNLNFCFQFSKFQKSKSLI